MPALSKHFCVVSRAIEVSHVLSQIAFAKFQTQIYVKQRGKNNVHKVLLNSHLSYLLPSPHKSMQIHSRRNVIPQTRPTSFSHKKWIGLPSIISVLKTSLSEDM